MKKKIFVIGLACILLIMSLGTVAGRVEVEASNQSSTSEELPDFEITEINNIRMKVQYFPPMGCRIPFIYCSIKVRNNGASVFVDNIEIAPYVDEKTTTVTGYSPNKTFESGKTYVFPIMARWLNDPGVDHTFSLVFDYDGGPLDDYKSGSSTGDYEESDETNNWISIVTRYNSRDRVSHFTSPALASLLQRLVSNFPLLQRILNI